MHVPRKTIGVLVAVLLLSGATLAQNDPPRGDRPSDSTKIEQESHRASSAVDPDTTAPWRYYPLVPGNVWEFTTGTDLTIRYEIGPDTLIGDTHFFQLFRSSKRPGGSIFYPEEKTGIRYDSSTTMVVEGVLGEDGELSEFRDRYAFCPLGAPFSDTFDCRFEGETQSSDHRVFGGTDGTWIFGEAADTLRGQTYKTFSPLRYFARVTFIADLGPVLLEYDGGFEALTYARIDGQEYGTERVVVAAEPDVPLPEPRKLSVWPNPARRWLHWETFGGLRGRVTVRVFDLLGREHLRRDVVLSPSGSAPSPLDISRLRPGTYLLQIADGKQSSPSALFAAISR